MVAIKGNLKTTGKGKAKNTAGAASMDIGELAGDVLAGKDTLPEPEELYGVQETKEVLILMAELASASVSWQFTNPSTFTTRFERIFPAGVAAIANIERVPAEIGDLSEKEIELLASTVEATLDLSKLNLTQAAIDKLKETVKTGEPYGIDDTEDMVRLFASLAALGIRAKTMNLATISAAAIGMAPTVFAALGGIANIPKELADLDKTELLRLHAVLASEFNIADENLEIAVEAAWRCVLAWYSAVAMLMRIRTQETKPKAIRDFSRELIAALGYLAVLVRTMLPLFQPPQSTPKVGEA